MGRQVSKVIPCQCGREVDHHPTCLVSQAFRHRCPDCKTPKRDNIIAHTRLCPLRAYRSP